VLKKYTPAPGLWPTEHLPTRREEARVTIEKKLSDLRSQVV
jgi:hypothetical protein